MPHLLAAGRREGQIGTTTGTVTGRILDFCSRPTVDPSRTQLCASAQLNDAKRVAAENIEELQKMRVRGASLRRSDVLAQFSALDSFLLLLILLRCRSC